MPDILDTIRRRRSVRSYDGRPLGPELRRRVEELLAAAGPGPFGHAPRFALIEKGRTGDGERLRLGTYGFISGARQFIAGAVAPGAGAEVDFGFVMERIVLELTRLGLGTCWLGGTFSRKEYGRAIRLGPDEWIPAVLAVGRPAGSRGVVERLVRWGAKADNRLPWDQLFFDGDGPALRPLDRQGAGPYAGVLDLVRIGPSASNKQPWRVVRQAGIFHLFLVRTPGYRRLVPSTDLQLIDLGIAMCHFESAAAGLGLPGGWDLSGRPPRPSLPGAEWISAWTTR